MTNLDATISSAGTKGGRSRPDSFQKREDPLRTEQAITSILQIKMQFMKVHILYVKNERMQCRFRKSSQCEQHAMREVGGST